MEQRLIILVIFIAAKLQVMLELQEQVKLKKELKPKVVELLLLLVVLL